VFWDIGITELGHNLYNFPNGMMVRVQGKDIGEAGEEVMFNHNTFVNIDGVDNGHYFTGNTADKTTKNSIYSNIDVTDSALLRTNIQPNLESNNNLFFNIGSGIYSSLVNHDTTDVELSVDPLSAFESIVNVNDPGNILPSGDDGLERGAQITHQIGPSGTLYGEPGWNEVQTSTPLWPWVGEESIYDKLCNWDKTIYWEVDDNYHFVEGHRGFCNSPSLTHYILNYHTNPAQDCFDTDQDGYDTCAVGEPNDDGLPWDCSDQNSWAYPGAEEICSGADNNCNGFIDEGWETWNCQPTCRNSGFTWAGNGGLDPALDCCGDDPLEANPYYYTEYANPDRDYCDDGNDNDCDGLVDHDDPDCGGTPPPCEDGDGDGYGDPASITCTYPELDCDDGNIDVNPGATEDCENGIDDDCDGDADPDDDDCYVPPACVDNDGDGYGSPASDECTYSELDCDDTQELVYPGAPEICGNLVDDNCNGEIDEALTICSPYNVDQSQDGINIADLIEVAKDYHFLPGTNSGLATDVNDDSYVNILDIVLVSSNFASFE